LIELFGDEAEEVRRAAARCFSRLRDEELGEYRDLVRAFAHSRAFDTENDQLLEALQMTTARMPDESCLACERFLEVVGEDAANIQLRAAADVATALEILVRSYNQSRDPALQARCLDLFDRMAEIGVYQVTQAFEQYER
jgi:hypothetical protein